MCALNKCTVRVLLISVVDGSDLLSHSELERSVEAGFSYADKLARIEDDLISKGIFVDANSPFFRMAKFKKANPEAMVID